MEKKLSEKKINYYINGKKFMKMNKIKTTLKQNENNNKINKIKNMKIKGK